MRKLLVAAALLYANTLWAWGGNGHKIVATVAAKGLSQGAADTIAMLLYNQSLADVASLPDAWRNTTEKATGNWHFVNIPTTDTAYDEARDCPHKPGEIAEDCAVAAIAHFRTVLADQTQTKAARARALTFLVHLIGDIHQPLHDADNHDRGGNDVLVSWFGKATRTIVVEGVQKEVPYNLHGIWDGEIIQRTGMDVAAFTQHLLTMPQPADTTNGTVVAWVNEAYDLAKSHTYQLPAGNPAPLGIDYYNANLPIVERQLLLGGLRLHAVLEAALGAPAAGASLPRPDHIVIVIDENKSFADILTSGHAPFLKQLAADGASLMDFHASHHPSQPNYIDFFAGDTLGVCDDSCPASTFSAANLGAALANAGFSFAGFAENLPSSAAAQRCHKDSKYASKHAPWVNFTNVAASASRNFSQFPHDDAGFSQLPTVSLVIPNLTNDMHNGSGITNEVKTGDAWLKAHLAAYATWAQTHNSLLIVTWDEDSYTGYHIHCPGVIQTPAPGDPNLIATILAGAPVQAGATSSTTYSHHDLLRTILDMYGIPPFAGAATAKDITGVWK